MNPEVSERPDSELKAESIGLLGKGNFSSGHEYEIILSRSSAVADGMHVILSSTVRDTEATIEQKSEAFAALLKCVSGMPLAQKYGFRLAYNNGQLLTREHLHLHAIIPGSAAEVAAAPRLVTPWCPQT